jgi:hypothetical protein
VPLPTSAILDWLVALGWDITQETGAPLYLGPYVPPEPDRLVVISPTPGPGYQLEGAADTSAFQALVRGQQGGDQSLHAQSHAETLAYALDALIFGAQFPAVLPSGHVLMLVTRLGGHPSPLGPSSDDADRFSFVCQYLVQAST